MKSIGVVIPIYNTAKYLKQCVESVLAQDYKKMFVVLVDDGSTDESPQICDYYAKNDERITVIHQKNLGPIASRYNGSKILNVNYLTFVDSDDFIAPNTYSTFTNQMEQGIDVIFWQIIRYYDTDFQKIVAHNFPIGFYDEIKIKKEIYPYMIWNFEKNIWGIDPSLCSKLIKKDLILQYLKSVHNMNFYYADDSSVIYPLLKKAKSLYLSEKNFYYHRQQFDNVCPPYLTDLDFFKKLYIFYEYTSQYFKDDPNLLEQLDTFYAYSTVFRNIKVRNKPQKHLSYLFPFNLIPIKKNIIIYGAGNVGKSYQNQLVAINYAHKILWVDKNYSLYNNLEVKNPEILKDYTNYDYVVIAVEDEHTATIIKNNLIDIGFNKDKIIWSIHIQ